MGVVNFPINTVQMEREEDCGDSRDPMLTENLPKCPTCICCDKGTPKFLHQCTSRKFPVFTWPQ